MMMRKHRVFNFSFIVLSVFALGSLVVLLGLGTWQVQRLKWKEALIERVETQVASDPIAFDALKDRTTQSVGSNEDPEYQPVEVTGDFEDGTEIFYYATRDGKPGYHIYAPLRVKGEGPHDVLFINRGFVPIDNKDITTRPASRVGGPATLTGLFRWPDFEKPNRFTPDNDLAENIFFWRDLDAMSELAGIKRETVYPFFIYAGNDGTGNLPIGGVSLLEFSNNHLQYAITWYGLALTLIGVYAALLIHRIRGK